MSEIGTSLPQESAPAAPEAGGQPIGDVILSMTDIVKSYRMGEEDQVVLKGIDLDVRQGEFVAILGPSQRASWPACAAARSASSSSPSSCSSGRMRWRMWSFR